MKKILATIFILILYTNVYSQAGINTNMPQATLDIVSHSSDLNGLIIHSSNFNEVKLFSIENNGDLSFSNALMPNNNSGSIGQYLVSQGDNQPPIWQGLPKGSSVQIFSAQSDDISTTKVGINTARNIQFSIMNSFPDESFGTWNSSQSRLTVAKKGVYLVTIGINAMNMRNASDVANAAGNLALYITSSTGGSYSGQGIIYADMTNYNYSTVVSNYFILNSGDSLRFIATSGNSSWYQGASFISVAYSELP